MKEILISVIIPIFNVEKYIERCARSLFEQTMKDGIEFIFVDDATTDNSINILEKLLLEYPQRGSQVRIIHHKNNQGLPQARRTGWQIAKGKYIGNCDSDDWIEPNMFAYLVGKAELSGSDMVWCDYYVSSNGSNIVCCQEMEENPDVLVREYMAGLKTKRVASLWNRIFRRVLLKKDLRYPVYSMTEDFVVTIQILLICKKVTYVDLPLYHYYVNHLSITNKQDKLTTLKRHSEIISNTEIVLDVLARFGDTKQYEEEIVSKKFVCKDMLSQLLNIKEYRTLWKNTYKEINSRIFFNRFIPVAYKRKAAFILLNLWPVYNLIQKLKTR